MRASGRRFMSASATRRRSCASALAKSRSRRSTYGETLTRNGVEISLHPAGHVLGSAQIRVASRARSGSPRATTSSRATAFRRPSSRCAATPSSPNRPSACRSTAGARRPKRSPSIDAWRRENAAAGRASLLFAYALGKAQRVLAHVDPALGPDRLPRRGRGDQRALSRGRRRPAADRVSRPRSSTSAISPAR